MKHLPDTNFLHIRYFTLFNHICSVWGKELNNLGQDLVNTKNNRKTIPTGDTNKIDMKFQFYSQD